MQSSLEANSGEVLSLRAFFAYGENQLARTRFEPGISEDTVKRSTATPHWLDDPGSLLNCNDEYLVFALGKGTAALVVVGSIHWTF